MVNTPCVEWDGTHTAAGYGQVTVDGHREYVHIVVYKEWYGFIPADHEIDHKCENPACYLITHLQAVTHQENILRAFRRGKEACRNGHPWTPENTYIRANGHRRCRRCHAAGEKKRQGRIRGGKHGEGKVTRYVKW